ncbi:hypothetical protein AC1031_018272 [Aphanomyces cochlioides]|nr:hypothetical protein AC1031_018272 [Aphanomyces cochlioides]
MESQRGVGDLEERLSYVLSANGDDKANAYDVLKIPRNLEDGALTDGGALHLFSREAMGLFSQYFCIGVLYGLIPSLKYPIYNVYLGMCAVSLKPPRFVTQTHREGSAASREYALD